MESPLPWSWKSGRATPTQQPICESAEPLPAQANWFMPMFLRPWATPTDAMPNRLGLAQWLVSDDNPLTARVTVNHFWETIFGHGIVETSEDSERRVTCPPSGILDWLATEFMQNGWSMKKIQQLMVMSATYRQSSRGDTGADRLAILTTSSMPEARVSAWNRKWCMIWPFPWRIIERQDVRS